jgi:hypothetical protein
MAPLSQLNTQIGRKLARPTSLLQARLMRDVPDSAYRDFPDVCVEKPSSAPSISQSHIERQLSNPPPASRTQQSNVAQTLVRMRPSRRSHTRKLSDRDPLASQQIRNQSRETTQSLSANQTTIQSTGPSRLSTSASLKRTMTLRRNSTARSVSAITCPKGESYMEVDVASLKARRFSFDYGPEILSLSEQKHEPQSNMILCEVCAAASALNVVKRQATILPRSGSRDIQKGNGYNEPEIAARRTGPQLPPQTFAEILGGKERVPTALLSQ